jgi:hypothetical protein
MGPGPLSRIWDRWIGLPRSICAVQLYSNTQVRSFASQKLVSPHAGRQRHRLGDCGDCQHEVHLLLRLPLLCLPLLLLPLLQRLPDVAPATGRKH